MPILGLGLNIPIKNRKGFKKSSARITPIIPLPTAEFYSNFEQYVIDGVRQADISLLTRGNIPITRQLVVADNITFNGFRFMRIKGGASDTGWTSNSIILRVTLQPISAGATIDGSTSNKFFNQSQVVFATTRTGALTEYDLITNTPTNNSTTTLVAGNYNITLLNDSGNIYMARLLNSTFPIDTTKMIYPNNNNTDHLVMQVF